MNRHDDDYLLLPVWVCSDDVAFVKLLLPLVSTYSIIYKHLSILVSLFSSDVDNISINDR